MRPDCFFMEFKVEKLCHALCKEVEKLCQSIL